MAVEFKVEAIGTVRSPVTQRTDQDWGQVVSEILMEPRYRPGLDGLEKFSHVLVLTMLHEATFDSGKHLRRRPRGLKEMPEVGIFSQRAKNRPNPIGVTAVKVIDVTERGFSVKGLDAIDGTPVLDIKPYYPHYDRVDCATVPAWVDRLMQGYF